MIKNKKGLGSSTMNKKGDFALGWSETGGWIIALLVIIAVIILVFIFTGGLSGVVESIKNSLRFGA